MIEGRLRKGDRVDQYASAHPSMAQTEKIVGFAKGTDGRRIVILEYWLRRKQRYVHTAVPERILREFGKRVEPRCKPREVIRNYEEHRPIDGTALVQGDST
jgi:hypothetical protein